MSQRATQCLSAAEAAELVRRPLPDAEAEAVARHLEQCPACASTVEALLRGDTMESALRGSSGPGGATPLPNARELIDRLKVLVGPRPAGAQPAPDTVPPGARGDPEQTGGATGSGEAEGPERPWDFLAPAERPNELGRLGPYRILEVLGAGGMGVVFRALDPQLQRPVALKAMRPALAASASAKKRFLREARATAAIKHDHIVAIYQVGEDRGAPFLAMEFLEGEPLDRRLAREGKLPVAEVLRIGREMADGLAAAHERGLIHRDIKPANVWLEGKRGRVKILDFGLARLTADQTNLTQQGAIVGTPAYMAPEQAAGCEVDARCDLFSLGCVLYRLAGGAPPFKGGDAMSILASLALDTPRPLRERNADVPPALEALIASLLAKEPAGRPASAQAVAEAIEAIERDLAREDRTSMIPPEATPAARPAKPAARARPAARRGRLVAVAVALAAAVLLAWLFGPAVYRVVTDQGVLVVEVTDPGIEVVITQNGAVVRDKTTQREFTLKAGSGAVEVYEKDGVKLATKQFELTRGGRTTVKVTPDEIRVATKPAARGADWPAAGPGPFDALRREDIPPDELRDAGGGDPARAPKDLVAVFGDSRLRGWGDENFPGRFSPDAKRFVCSDGGAIRVWDATSGRLLRSLPGRMDVTSFTPDGRRFLTVGNGARVWDADTGDEVVMAQGAAEPGNFTAAVFSPDGKRFATGHLDRKVRLHDAATGDVLQTMEGPAQAVWRLAFSPDGKCLAAGGGTAEGKPAGELLVWDAADGKRLQTIPQPAMVLRLTFFPDSRRLLCSLHNVPGVHIYDAPTGQEVGTVRDVLGGEGIALMPDGNRLVGAKEEAGQGEHFYRWDLRKPAARPALVPLSPSAKVLDVRPDGRLLAVNLYGAVQFYDLEAGKVVLPPDGPAGYVFRLDVGSDGRRVLVTTQDGSLRVWDTATGRDLPALSKDRAHPFVLLSRDGKRLAAVTNDGIKVLDAAGGEELTTIRAGGYGYILGMAFSPDGTRLAVGVPGQDIVKVFDTAEGEDRLQLKGHKGGVSWVGYHPDGTRLFTFGMDKAIKVWDAATGQELHTFPEDLAQNGDKRSAALSPDGKLLAAVDYPHVLVWDLETGAVRRKFENLEHTTAVAFSPDGRQLATSHLEGTTVRTWDLATGKKVREWTLQGMVQRLAYAPDGRHLLTGNGNGTVYVLRLAEK